MACVRASVLRLISDLDDLGESLGRGEFEFYRLALAEGRLAVADEDGVDREIEHVEETVA
jgi:hypothetical protein